MPIIFKNEISGGMTRLAYTNCVCCILADSFVEFSINGLFICLDVTYFDNSAINRLYFSLAYILL